jgi:hypothetical protein
MKGEWKDGRDIELQQTVVVSEDGEKYHKVKDKTRENSDSYDFNSRCGATNHELLGRKIAEKAGYKPCQSEKCYGD